MLDRRLENDSLHVMDLKSGQLRMIKDGANEWFLIIPSHPNSEELIDLPLEEHTKLMHDIRFVSEIVKKETSCDKLNVAALGNQVKQLHIHIIARYESDRAWPNPLWGSQSPVDFDAKNVDVWKERFNNA